MNLLIHMNSKAIISIVSVLVLALIVGGLLWSRAENDALPPAGEPVATTTPNAVTPLPYGAVTLSVGERATFPGLTIRPVSIEEDSRCPKDVQCIQAGTVRVKVEVASSGKTSTHTIGLGKSVAVDGATISLTAVMPAPVSTVQLTAADYALTFTVTKPASAMAGCFVGGCSAQICSDQPDVASNCEFRAEYACYRTAKCERQSGGQCGWTDTAALRSCLLNPPPM